MNSPCYFLIFFLFQSALCFADKPDPIPPRTLTDLEAVAMGVGIDLRSAKKNAISGNDSSLYLLLWMAGNVELDGAASEGYGWMIVNVAKKVGDKRIAKVTHKLKPTEIQALKIHVEFEYMNGGEVVDLESMNREFPKFSKSLSSLPDQKNSR